LINLVDGAVTGGWTTRQACRYLELSQRRVERWRGRGDDLDDAPPGGNPVHGITPAEQDEIVAVYMEWADVDRSHRKLAHRGSWLGRFWVDPSTVRRVLERRDLRFRAPKRQGRSARRPWPDWVQEAPNRIWIYDTTHWTNAGAATTVISDVISRKWIADITSADETSIEVQAVFNRALRIEDLNKTIDDRNPHGIAFDPDSDAVPVLLVMSDNGPQMTSGSTREFMALCWLATHYGRPGTPTDQAWIESLFGHLKTEHPHLELIADIDVLRAELDIQRTHYNTVRLHAGIGYVTPDQEHRGEGTTVRAARRDGLTRARQQRITYNRNQPSRGPHHAG
jgi:transposase InsO family protein